MTSDVPPPSPTGESGIQKLTVAVVSIDGNQIEIRRARTGISKMLYILGLQGLKLNVDCEIPADLVPGQVIKIDLEPIWVLDDDREVLRVTEETRVKEIRLKPCKQELMFAHEPTLPGIGPVCVSV